MRGFLRSEKHIRQCSSRHHTDSNNAPFCDCIDVMRIDGRSILAVTDLSADEGEAYIDKVEQRYGSVEVASNILLALGT